ncbi:hypothetical protein Pyn_36454 [Prunus yedoensis var. nudiflora]|uniref:HTH myb-type domain-containing protein n=1 Tax=Prunus yedoensis var. nudiflora TaxID=2094558 RepID=A0A314Y9A8_PRUYE|nr:hypothetical protein Pyn_36454 [Prunus yedoensis var. nudiflora]
MTPQEERLVLELHSKWGNRKLPGRTDNEIKNYWRTHMRKKAQEKKRAASPSSSSSNCGLEIKASSGAKKTGGDHQEQEDDKKRDQKEYSLDDIWKDINLPEVNSIEPVYNGYSEEACNIISCPLMASPAPWEYCSDSLWKMDEEESKIEEERTSNLPYNVVAVLHEEP